MTAGVTLRDKISNQILETYSIEDLELAYSTAAKYELLGIDVEIISKGLPQILASQLGLSEEQLKRIDEELDSEINGHNDSCCYQVKE